MSARTDDQLVADFRAGRDEAFGEVVARHGPALLRYARRRMPAAAPDAEDVVQESLIRAYLALRRDDRPMLLRPWLYRIVRNCVLDGLRSPTHGTLPDDVALPRDAFDEVDDARRVADLVAAVIALPERQRRALVLRALEGRSHAAIAAELDTSVAATKALVARARTELRPHAHAA